MPGVFYVIGQMVLSNLVQKVGVCRCYVAHIVVSLCLVEVRINQTAYTDAWINTKNLHVQVFLWMNTWLFETCRRRYNWIKLLKKVCNLLVLITYVYHNARFKRRKVYMYDYWEEHVVCRIVHLLFSKNISPSMRSLPMGSFFTDIHGLKFCVQFLHWDLQSFGVLRSVYC